MSREGFSSWEAVVVVSKVIVLFVVALDRLAVVKVMYEESAMGGNVK